MIYTKPIKRIADLVASNPIKLAPLLAAQLERLKVKNLSGVSRPGLERILGALAQAGAHQDFVHCSTVVLQYRGTRPLDWGNATARPEDWLIGNLGEGRPPMPGKPFEVRCPDCGEVITNPSRLTGLR